jgi:hypothetical protein
MRKVEPRWRPLTSNSSEGRNIELYKVNWKANSGGGGLKSVHSVSLSEFWTEILNTEPTAVYETEAIEKRYLV